MLTAASRHTTRHLVLLVGLAAAVIVLFALLLQLILGLAAPPSGQVTGSFGANRTADYGRGSERPVAPQRSS